MADLGRKTGATSYEIALQEPTGGLLIALASGSAIFIAETIKVELKGKKRDVVIIPEMTILKAIELFEQDDLVVKTLVGEAQAVIPFTAAMDKIGVDINPSDGERIVVTLGSMTSGSNYDLYQVEAEDNVRACYQIDQKTLTTGTKQKFNVDGYDQAVLPISGLTEVTFRFKESGRTITKSVAQIIFEQTINGEVKQIRGIALTGDAGTLDISSMFEPSARLSIDCSRYDNIEVTATNGYTFETLKTQTF